MADIQVFSFNSGEISPLLDGRSDLEKYYSGCRLLENMVPLPYGPAERRPGTYFVAELKDNSKKAKLVPFQYSIEQAYILEYGDEYIRFCMDRGQIVSGVGTEDLTAVDDGALVAHWLLNEEEGVTVVNADNPGTYDGTATADTSILNATGKVGTGCFDLDGQYTVEIADAAAFSFTDNADDTAFSIACWGFVTEQANVQVLMSKWRNISTTSEWRFSLNNERKLQLHLADSSADLTGNRVAQWYLNDDAADNHVDDVSTNHDGVLTPSQTTAITATGKINACLDFGGAEAVEVVDNAALSFGDGTDDSAFSVAAWIYVTDGETSQVILGKYDRTTGSEAREWRLFLSSAEELYFELYDESANTYVRRKSNSALSTGWHFVVGTYNGMGGSGAWSGITLYVDGSAVGSVAYAPGGYDSMENTATKVTIGAAYGTDGNPTLYFFQDKIDNVILFSIELSQANVSTLWNDGNGTESLTGAISLPFAVSDDAIGVGWHFLACTYSAPADETTAADGIILYVDGVAVDSTATNDADYTAMQNGAEEIRIGSQRNSADDGNENFWADKIDEVSIFSDVLTPAEIASLYSSSPYEISSNYQEADLFGLQHAQSADVLFNVHGSYPQSKLMRYAHNLWELEEIVFDWPPFLDENDGDTTITPSATTGTIDLTASIPIFTSSHTGSYWLIKHPRTADEATAPNKVGSAEADGFFNAAAEVTGSLKDVKGAWNFRTAGTWTGEIVIERSYDDGTTWHTLTTVTSEGDQNFNITGNEEDGDAWYRARAVDPPGTLAWANETIPTLSVERYYHYGIVKITGFMSATVVSATVIRTVGSTGATKLWSEGAWSDGRGYPVTTAFYEGRQFYAGTSYRPLNIWGSRIRDYENMELGSLDDDSVQFTIDSTMQNMIRWLVGQEVLLIGTSGGEWRLGSLDPSDAITPTNPIQPRIQTTYGSKKIQALLLANVVLFVSGAGTETKGRVIRGAQYIFEKGEVGGYDAEPYTLLSEHITKSGIVGMAYQQNPYPILWCVRDDGVLIGMVFEPGQKVWGWFRCVIDGDVESVAVIRGVAEDEVWIIVKREINGVTKRYIEYFKPRDWGDDQADCFFVDSGLSFDGGDAVTITGITRADPGVVTAVAHGFSDGDHVRIRGVAGMLDINNKVFTVDSPATDTFSLRDKLDTIDWDTTDYDVFSDSVEGDTEYDSDIIKNVSAADIASIVLGALIVGTGIVADSNTTITEIDDDWFRISTLAFATNTAVSFTVQGTVEQVDNTFSNLSHLEAKTVSILGDGSVHADVVVSSGTVTLTDYFNKVHIGLPFTSKLMPMKLAVPGANIRGKVKRIHQIIFSFYKTLGAKFGPTSGDETIPFRKTTDPMGSAPPLFTGEKIQTFPGGHELEGDIYVEQTQPLPLCVRSITAKLGIYD